eukprot:gene7902-692_t
MATSIQARIGLELHARLKTVTKAFSPAVVSFAHFPNSLATSFDAAHPGTYPVLNHAAVRAALSTGIALNMNIADRLQFDRKHYFYYDLPLGYQITQERYPICTDGYIDIAIPTTLELASRQNQTDLRHSVTKRIRIARLQLEHDSAKSIHTANDATLVDLNRAGIGLLEIVTKPDFYNAVEAVAFVRELLSILKVLHVCDGSLSEGSLRVDANINIIDTQRNIKTPRVEVKNINGLRFLAKAIDHEIARHQENLLKGKALHSETRLFDPRTSTTVHMRMKEDNVEYRYMPDPDLPPVHISRSLIESCQQNIPFLPTQQASNVMTEYNLSMEQAKLLISIPGALKLFSDTMELLNDVRFSLNTATLIVTDILAHSKKVDSVPLNETIAPSTLADLIKVVEGNLISRRASKEILQRILEGDNRLVEDIVADLDLKQQSDVDVLQELASTLVAQHPKQRKKYLNGQLGVLGFFVGKMMAQTGGKANPQKAKHCVEEALKIYA